MRFVIFLIPTLLLLFGCGESVKIPISEPEISIEFYQSMYEQTSEHLKGVSTEIKVRQKIYYAQKLGWPEDALSGIQYLDQKYGLTNELMGYYLQYYSKFDHQEELKRLIHRWELVNPLSDSLYRMKLHLLVNRDDYRESDKLIRDYLENFDGPEQQIMAANAYLILEDTLYAVYHLSKALKDLPTDTALLSQYIPLISSLGFNQRVQSLILSNPVFQTTYVGNYYLALSSYRLGLRLYGKRLLYRWASHPRIMFQLAEWYREERQLDSAIHYANRLIAIDSSRNALFFKASVFEDRGWLNASYQLFAILTTRDPNDSLAQSRSEIVSRKIAYLRSIRESAERQIPVFKITPKEIE